MKNLLLILMCSILFFSCKKEKIEEETCPGYIFTSKTEFIKAGVNGLMQNYNIVTPGINRYIDSANTLILMLEEKCSPPYKRWSISAFNNFNLDTIITPFTFKSDTLRPNAQVIFEEINFNEKGINVGSTYLGTTANNLISLTITSKDNDTIKGYFSGSLILYKNSHYIGDTIEIKNGEFNVGILRC